MSCPPFIRKIYLFHLLNHKTRLNHDGWRHSKAAMFCLNAFFPCVRVAGVREEETTGGGLDSRGLFIAGIGGFTCERGEGGGYSLPPPMDIHDEFWPRPTGGRQHAPTTWPSGQWIIQKNALVGTRPKTSISERPTLTLNRFLCVVRSIPINRLRSNTPQYKNGPNRL